MGVEVNILNKSSSTQPQLKTAESNAPETQANSPFCIAIMGDFSGRLNHAQSNADKKPEPRLIEIDRDNFEEVMARFKISLNLNISDNEIINIELKELDDFHPDELYENLESFSKLRSLRRRLNKASSFARAAAEMQGWLPSFDTRTIESQPEAEQIPADTATPNLSTDNLLDSILGSQQDQSKTTTSEATHIDNLIKSIVAPYVEPAADPRQEELLATLDTATQNHMRDILHNAEFQAMESAWQAVYFLIKRLETDSKLKIFLLDISKQELQDDLAVDDLSSSSIYKLFCDPSEGDLPWSILLGNYSFTDSIDDVLSLANIGAIAQQARAPFIAAANEALTGCESFSKTPDYEDWNHSLSDGVAKAWQMLRESPVATYIGLALPRFILRLPYGKKSKPIETFSFEEMTEENNHESYLWGNAAFIKVECIARNFKNNGWNMHLNEVFQTNNLPVHYYTDDGEMSSKPVAEITLTEKGGQIINNNGLISLWSVKNTDCIRSTEYNSIDINAQKLSGRWNS